MASAEPKPRPDAERDLERARYALRAELIGVRAELRALLDCMERMPASSAPQTAVITSVSTRTGLLQMRR